MCNRFSDPGFLFDRHSIRGLSPAVSAVLMGDVWTWRFCALKVWGNNAYTSTLYLGVVGATRKQK